MLLVLTVVLSFPSVQSKVAQRAISWANDTYDIDAELEGLRYIFPNQIAIDHLYLPDEQGDTMLYAAKLNVSIGGYSQLSGTLGLQNIDADSLKFYFLTKVGDTIPNFNKFIAKVSPPPDTTKEPKPFKMDILDIQLNNSRFWLENLNCDSNCTAFKIVNINTDIESFKLNGSDFDVDVNNLAANDQYGLELKELWGSLAYRADKMEFKGLHIKTNQSTINGDYGMYYSSMGDMGDFVNKVTIDADLEQSTIASVDIQQFAAAFPDFKVFTIKGKATGTINDLQLEDLKLTMGEATSLAGNFGLKNPTKPDSLWLHAKPIKFATNPTDAQYFYNLFTNDTLPELLDSLGTISFNGDYKGYLTDFKTSGELNTAIGSINVDLLFNQKKEEEIHYKGTVKINQFNIGKLLASSSLGLVDAKLTLDGKGFDPKTMKTDLIANIGLLEANDYPYKNINIDGKIAKGRFLGAIDIDDPNLKFAFNGDATFKGETSTYNFKAEIEKADLHALNFTDESVSVVSGELDINLEAKDYENWTGLVKLHNATYENPANFYFFEDVIIESTELDTASQITVSSSILDAKLLGTFTYKGLADAFMHEISKYSKGMKPVAAPENENFVFDFQVKNTQVITEIFAPKLTIDPATSLKGSFSGERDRLGVELKSPGITYDGNQVNSISLNYSGSVSKSTLDFDINQLKLASGFQMDSISLGNYYYNDTLFYTLGAIFKDSVDGNIRLDGYALQNDTSNFEFGIFKSPFNIGYESFEILAGNKIIIDTAGVYIDNLRIANGNKKIAINGNVSDNDNEILRLKFQGFGMNLINYFLATPEAQFKGKLYGDVILSQLLAKPRFAADIHIDSLKMNTTTLGNFSVTSDWTLDNDTVFLGAQMLLGDLKTFEVDGYYQADSTGTIAFDIGFDRFRMAALNPFLSGIAENVRGFLDGNIKISGPVSAPKIEGSVQLPKVAFTISFLQTDYNFEGVPSITFKQDEILFPDLQLRDSKYGTSGKLAGSVKHDNFRDFMLDLKIKADELLVLNTPATSEDAYYGTAFATGEIRMQGPPDKLSVTADITTERKTTFNIPLSGSRTESQTSFVNFVDRSQPDTTDENAGKRFNIDKGISLEFDMNVNENAQLSIILDERTGNKLDVNGNGNVQLGITRAGELELFGTYTINEGIYNFNIQGFLRKKFEVQTGSSVTFNGSPFDAIVDITAKYTTRADPSPIVPNYSGGRVLTEVYLKIEGNLATPKITFTIETPRASALVQTVIRSIGTGDSKTDQVFSLLAQNAFIPEQGISGAGGGQINGWDILANQAASTLNKLTDRFDLSLNYQADPQGGPSDETNSQEELEVGVSTSFLDDRVTVTTSLGVPVGANQSTVAGEIQVEYSITEDGRFRAKAFNRELENTFINTNTYQQGVGVFYRIDFNNATDFWRKLTGNKEKPTEPVDEPDAVNTNTEEAANAKG